MLSYSVSKDSKILGLYSSLQVFEAICISNLHLKSLYLGYLSKSNKSNLDLNSAYPY